MYRSPISEQKYTQTESEGLEKIFHANGHAENAGVARCITDKIDFKTKAITRDKGGYYIILK